jgi:hypothetical protein
MLALVSCYRTKPKNFIAYYQLEVVQDGHVKRREALADLAKAVEKK